MVTMRHHVRPVLTVLCSLALLAGTSCAGERPELTSEIVLEQPDPTPLPPSTDASLSQPLEVTEPESSVATEAEPSPPTESTPQDASSSDTAGSDTNAVIRPEILVIRELAVYPHDDQAYTQGLFVDEGVLVESTGQPNESTVRRVDIETGDIIEQVDIPNQALWGEGLTRVDDMFVQLTYLAGIAYYWDADTLTLIKEESYTGEGWGLCLDGDRLVMTDGSDQLFFRDPLTFEEVGRVTVTLEGESLTRINELECVDGQVWANIFTTNLIVRIDPDTGIVNRAIDATALGAPRPATSSVLNGIAYDAQTETFLLTGKDWPTMHRVVFEAPSS